MKKRFLVLGMSILMSLCMTSNGFAAIFNMGYSVKDEHGNEYISQNHEEYVRLVKESYDKYGVAYYIDEISEPQAYTYNELKEKAELEAWENFREFSKKEMEVIPKMKQSVTCPDENTTVYDDGFKGWSGVRGIEGHTLQSIRIVTTTRNNRDGSYTLNFKVYNTDNELIDTNKYFISTSIPGYIVDKDKSQPEFWYYIAGNDVSITLPGKTISAPNVNVMEKEKGKSIAFYYAATANELNQYNDSVYRLPYATRAAYQKTLDESIDNYNKAIEETKAH
ncbi:MULTISPECIES: hypothetical protein [unclassified Lacrimispora]|uniref:hypothetical protein n=1 Tax=unclassified Lacrimispora TaxID=2719232 RepID=UPI00376F91E4